MSQEHFRLKTNPAIFLPKLPPTFHSQKHYHFLVSQAANPPLPSHLTKSESLNPVSSIFIQLFSPSFPYIPRAFIQVLKASCLDSSHGLLSGLLHLLFFFHTHSHLCHSICLNTSLIVSFCPLPAFILKSKILRMEFKVLY